MNNLIKNIDQLIHFAKEEPLIVDKRTMIIFSTDGTRPDPTQASFYTEAQRVHGFRGESGQKVVVWNGTSMCIDEAYQLIKKNIMKDAINCKIDITMQTLKYGNLKKPEGFEFTETYYDAYFTVLKSWKADLEQRAKRA